MKSEKTTGTEHYSNLNGLTPKTATFKNKATGETKKVSGVKDLAQAWNLIEPLSPVWGWNWIDVIVISLN